jgi:hypothetical protein
MIENPFTAEDAKAAEKNKNALIKKALYQNQRADRKEPFCPVRE